MKKTFPSTIPLNHYNYDNMLQIQNTSNNYLDNQYGSLFGSSIPSNVGNDTHVENLDNQLYDKFRREKSFILKDIIAPEITIKVSDQSPLTYNTNDTNSIEYNSGATITRRTIFRPNSVSYNNTTNYEYDTSRLYNGYNRNHNQSSELKKPFDAKQIDFLRQFSSESISSSDCFNNMSDPQFDSFKDNKKSRSRNKLSLDEKSMQIRTITAALFSNDSSSESDKASKTNNMHLSTEIFESSNPTLDFNNHHHHRFEFLNSTPHFEINRESSPVISTNAVVTGANHRINQPRPHKKKSFTIIADEKANTISESLQLNNKEQLIPFVSSTDFQINSPIKNILPQRSFSSTNLKLPVLKRTNVSSDETKRPSVQFDISNNNVLRFQNQYDTSEALLLHRRELRRPISSILPKSNKFKRKSSIFKRYNDNNNDNNDASYNNTAKANRKNSKNPTSRQKGFLRVINSVDSAIEIMPINEPWMLNSLDNLSNLPDSMLDRSKRKYSNQTETTNESDRRSSNLSSVTTSDFSFRRSLISPGQNHLTSGKIKTGNFLNFPKTLKLKNSTFPKRRVAKSSNLSPIIGTPNRDINPDGSTEKSSSSNKEEIIDTETRIPIKNGSNISIEKHISRPVTRSNSRASKSRSNSPQKEISSASRANSQASVQSPTQSGKKSKSSSKDKSSKNTKSSPKKLTTKSSLADLKKDQKLTKNDSSNPAQKDGKKLLDLQQKIRSKFMTQLTNASKNTSPTKSGIPKKSSAKKKFSFEAVVDKKLFEKKNAKANKDSKTAIAGSKKKDSAKSKITSEHDDTYASNMEKNNDNGDDVREDNNSSSPDLNDKLKLITRNSEASMTSAALAVQPVQITTAVTTQLNKASSSSNSDQEKSINNIDNPQIMTSAASTDAQKSSIDPQKSATDIQKSPVDAQKSMPDKSESKTGTTGMQNKTADTTESSNENKMASEVKTETIQNVMTTTEKLSTNSSGKTENFDKNEKEKIVATSPVASSQPIEAAVSVLSNNKHMNLPLPSGLNNNAISNEIHPNASNDMAERISERAISVLPDVENESSNLHEIYIAPTALLSDVAIKEIKSSESVDTKNAKITAKENSNSGKSPQTDADIMNKNTEQQSTSNNNNYLDAHNQKYLDDKAEKKGCCGRSKCSKCFKCSLCSRLFMPCRRFQGCLCCRKKVFDNEATVIVKEVNEKAIKTTTSCWKGMKCCKRKSKKITDEKIVQPCHMDTIKEEPEASDISKSKKKKNKFGLCIRKIFCCRATNKVDSASSSGDSGNRICCCIPYRRKKRESPIETAWQDPNDESRATRRRESILSVPAGPPESRCTRFMNKLKFWKKKKPPVRRASQTSRKQSLAPTNPPEDTRPKLHNDLVDYNSKMKAAIPVLPIYFAYFCTLCNILIPGLGTILSGLFCLCVGIPRFSQYDSAKARIGAFVINCFVGVAQFFCVIFCFVGWGWSIWWGSIMMKSARKLQKIRKVERLEVEEERRQANLASEKKIIETSNVKT